MSRGFDHLAGRQHEQVFQVIAFQLAVAVDVEPFEAREFRHAHGKVHALGRLAFLHDLDVGEQVQLPELLDGRLDVVAGHFFPHPQARVGADQSRIRRGVAHNGEAEDADLARRRLARKRGQR